MRSREWIDSPGVIAQGYQVASGLGRDVRFPRGTIAPQLEIFAARIPGFATYFEGPVYPGTINIKFSGSMIEIGMPELYVSQVKWTRHFPPEDFYLSAGQIVTHGGVHNVYLYIPEPVTKPDHPAHPDVVEILAPYIDGVSYGDAVILRHSAQAIRLVVA
jgi:hypothetical protein